MEQVGEYLKRLQLSSSVGSQAQEYYRLCEVKCPRAFSPSCLAAICVELSCHKLRVPLDKVGLGLRLSVLQNSQIFLEVIQQ